MSRNASQMAAGMNHGKLKELRQRLLFVLGALIVFRMGAHIPVPGVNPNALALMFEQQSGTILDMFNMFSGGALERFTIFALGIMPYISASIIMQLMTVVVPALEQMKKEGEAGRRKITSTPVTVPLSWQHSRLLVSQLHYKANKSVVWV